MTNELKERLEALSKKANVDAQFPDYSISSNEMDLFVELRGLYASGDLITRQELDEAVAAEREGMVGDTAKLLQQWFIKGLSSEKMQDAPFVAARARSEQEGGA